MAFNCKTIASEKENVNVTFEYVIYAPKNILCNSTRNLYMQYKMKKSLKLTPIRKLFLKRMAHDIVHSKVGGHEIEMLKKKMDKLVYPTYNKVFPAHHRAILARYGKLTASWYFCFAGLNSYKIRKWPHSWKARDKKGKRIVFTVPCETFVFLIPDDCAFYKTYNTWKQKRYYYDNVYKAEIDFYHEAIDKSSLFEFDLLFLCPKLKAYRSKMLNIRNKDKSRLEKQMEILKNRSSYHDQPF